MYLPDDLSTRYLIPGSIYYKYVLSVMETDEKPDIVMDIPDQISSDSVRHSSETGTGLTKVDLIASGCIADVSGVLKRYCPTIYSHFPAKFWKTIQVDGAIYQLPSYFEGTETGIWLINKSARESLQIPIIQNYHDLVQLMIAACELERVQYPFYPISVITIPELMRDTLDAQYGIKCIPLRQPPTHVLRNNIFFYRVGENSAIYNILETPDDRIKHVIRQMSELVDRGIYEAKMLYPSALKPSPGVKTDRYELLSDTQSWAVSYIEFNPLLMMTYTTKQQIEKLNTILNDEGVEVFNPYFTGVLEPNIDNIHCRIMLRNNESSIREALRYFDLLYTQKAFEYKNLGLENIHWKSIGESRYVRLPTDADFQTSLQWQLYDPAMAYDHSFIRYEESVPNCILNEIYRFNARGSHFELDDFFGFSPEFEDRSVSLFFEEMVPELKKLISGELSLTDNWHDFHMRFLPEAITITSIIQSTYDEYIKRTSN